MSAEKKSNQDIIQNLNDAGCETETIMLFLQKYADGQTKDQLFLLAAHRKKLLSEIHGEQAKLDCLDYLIHQIKKDQSAYTGRGL